MPSFYAFLQFVPTITGDERINFGVVTFDDEGSVSRFLDDWSRVEAFAFGRNIEFLHRTAREITESPPAGDEIRMWASGWHGSIQVTRPRASLLPKEELLKSVLDALTPCPEVDEEPPYGSGSRVSAIAQRWARAAFNLAHYNPDDTDAAHLREQIREFWAPFDYTGDEDEMIRVAIVEAVREVILGKSSFPS